MASPDSAPSTAASADPTSARSAWAPLRVQAFRFLWLAQLFSMVGTWMQTVGAQWLLVDDPNAATLVALVQTLAMLPVLLLALPAGALADIVDRRRMLVVVQGFQVAVGAVLTALSLTDRLTPTLLLTLTFLLGCGGTVTIPGYQALVQELVPRDQLRSAYALGGVALNTARAIGPAIAGLLVAQAGVTAVFAINALTYLVLGAVLTRLRRPAVERSRLPERFGGALLAGWRYVRHAPIVRRILLRSLLFAVPGSALWALLPLVASRRLGLGAGGYGVLLAALGVGAVGGAVLLPWLSRLSANRLVLFTGLVFAGATLVSVVAGSAAMVVAALVPAGVAWLAAFATLGGTLQAFLPNWVRARGLSIQQMALAGGQAIGSFAWGLLAQWQGVAPALLAAAVLLAASTMSVLVWPLRDQSGLDRTPVEYWPDPHLEYDPDLDDGPILVTVTYTLPPDRVEEFLEAMAPVRRSRLRTGATSFALYRDGEEPNRIIEVSLYPTWAEHLRQHTDRLLGSDREYEQRAIALTDSAPQVSHLFPARAQPPAEE